MNFANIRNNTIIDFNSKYLDSDIERVNVDEEIYQAWLEDRNKVIYQDGEIVLNPNYEAEQEQKEKERIAMLSCTKRDFALMLQAMGVDYFTQLKPLIDSNAQARLEWELCERLYRFNPMIDLMAGQLGVTPEQLDGLFQYANGEITIEEFRGLLVKPDEELPTDEIVLPEIEEENADSTDIQE